MMDNKNKEDKIKPMSMRWIGIVGFLIAVTLLTIAIFLSINQEKMERMSKLNETTNQNQIEAASSIFSKNVNEVMANEVLGTADKSDKLTMLNKTLEDSKEENDNGNLKKTETEIKESSNKNKTEANSKINENNKTNESKKIEKTIKKDNTPESNTKKEKKTENNTDKKNNENNDNEVQFIKPANGEVINEFSMDSLIYSNTLEEWVTHRGIDIKGDMGENVLAIADGTITSIKNDPRYGLSITIEHNDGFKSIYSCMLSTEDGLEEGTKVSQGQVIGKMGNSGVFETADGTHLHFELLQNGEYVNPEMYIK